MKDRTGSFFVFPWIILSAPVLAAGAVVLIVFGREMNSRSVVLGLLALLLLYSFVRFGYLIYVGPEALKVFSTRRRRSYGFTEIDGVTALHRPEIWKKTLLARGTIRGIEIRFRDGKLLRLGEDAVGFKRLLTLLTQIGHIGTEQPFRTLVPKAGD